MERKTEERKEKDAQRFSETIKKLESKIQSISDDKPQNEITDDIRKYVKNMIDLKLQFLNENNDVIKTERNNSVIINKDRVKCKGRSVNNDIDKNESNDILQLMAKFAKMNPKPEHLENHEDIMNNEYNDENSIISSKKEEIEDLIVKNIDKDISKINELTEPEFEVQPEFKVQLPIPDDSNNALRKTSFNSNYRKKSQQYELLRDSKESKLMIDDIKVEFEKKFQSTEENTNKLISEYFRL